MLLAFDVGNTNTVIGCFEGDSLRAVIRLQTRLQRTIDEYTAIVMSALERKLGPKATFSSAIVSSVVPPIVPELSQLLQEQFGITPLVVGPGTKTGLSIKVKDPSGVGADRIVNAVAAKELYGFPSVVIDFGTATSFDVLSQDGEYLGGIIAPGLQVSLDALVGSTAKLPKIQIQKPTRLIGNDTESAMRSGVVLGYECLVEGLVRKLKDELGDLKAIVATGGYGKLFSELPDFFTEYAPDLTLQGLRIIAKRNEV